MPILEFKSRTKEAYCVPHNVLVFCTFEHTELPRTSKHLTVGKRLLVGYHNL